MKGEDGVKRAWRVAGIMGIMAAIACSGCGQAQETTVLESASRGNAPLPDWAPRNPSPEFLRAAKVLKPFPLGDMLRASEEDDLSKRATARYAIGVWSAGYEFFGTLSDRQIERLLSGGDQALLMPVGSMTAAQRAALDGYFEASRQQGKDRLVELYRVGAKEDLSNVDAGFSLRGNVVRISCRVGSGGDYAGFEDSIAGM
jgi:hypothetical protein